MAYCTFIIFQEKRKNMRLVVKKKKCIFVIFYIMFKHVVSVSVYVSVRHLLYQFNIYLMRFRLSNPKHLNFFHYLHTFCLFLFYIII